MKAARILAIIFNKAKRLDTSKELTDVSQMFFKINIIEIIQNLK